MERKARAELGMSEPVPVFLTAGSGFFLEGWIRIRVIFLRIHNPAVIQRIQPDYGEQNLRRQSNMCRFALLNANIL